MVIGQRIKELREAKNLSQGEVEKRTGLLRCYTSRVENGHTIPSIETLEKYAAGLGIPLYQFFYDGDAPVQKMKFSSDGNSWGAEGKELEELRSLVKALAKMSGEDRRLLLQLATRMARKIRRPKSPGVVHQV